MQAGITGSSSTVRWSPNQTGQAVRGYITNEYGDPAEPLRLLAQALDASGAVVGQQIAWVPEGVGGFERAYFDILSDYSFLQAEADPRDPFKRLKNANHAR